MLNTGSLFWLVPAIFALFAATFGVIAIRERSLASPRWAAAAFLFAVIGSVFDTQRANLPHYFPAFAVPLHLLALACVLQSFLSRHKQPDIVRRLAAVILCAAGVHAYFGFALPSSFARVINVNFAGAMLCVIAVSSLRPHRRDGLDRFIFWLLMAVGLSYLARAVIIVVMGQQTGFGDNYDPSQRVWSQYLLAFYLSSALLAIVAALILIVANGFDMVQRHYHSSLVDPLTRAANRRALDQWIDQEGLAGPAFGAAIMVDLDRFKTLNDSYGHAAGDAVLIAVAGALEAKLGSFCRIARIGGEEFAVLVPEAIEDSAGSLAIAARLAVADCRPAAPFERLTVTASIGLAGRIAGTTVTDMLKRADLALYQAKANGRDQAMRADNQDGLCVIRQVA